MKPFKFPDCELCHDAAPLNELDIACMTREEMVDWCGGHVASSDVLRVIDSFEYRWPGIGRDYRKEYRGGDIPTTYV